MDTLNDKETKTSAPSWWWVNQGQTFKPERKGGYIWAPQKGKNGQSIFHHVNVSQVRAGDVIWHYVDGKIISVSRAISDAVVLIKPEELGTENWATEGYSVSVQYFDLDKPVERNAIPLPLRTELSGLARSPFTRDGAVNQGYLFALSQRFVSEVVSIFPQLRPPGVQISEFIDTSVLAHSRVSFDLSTEVEKLIAFLEETGFKFEPWQIACYLAAIRTKPFLILAGVSGSGKSQLPQLIASATGTDAELVPVRPDWTDSSEILGYVQLQGKLSTGKLLELAERANRNLKFNIFAL